jgi:TolB-like protein
MMKYRIFPIILLFACALLGGCLGIEGGGGVKEGLSAQNVSLDQAVQTSAQEIETRLPQGAKTAVLTFTSTKQAFSDYIIDEIATAFSASGNLQVIDRQHTDAIRKEFNIQFSGDVSDDEVKRIGHQLGAQYVVTGSLVDIGTAYRFRVAAINIETAVREGSSSLNININDPQVVFLLTGQRSTQTTNTPGSGGTYRIGDKGPGGGTVFFARNGKYMECSGELGRHTWQIAVTLAQNYDGGGFSDWRLPTKDELNLMYVNLKARNLGGFTNILYWSSSETFSRGAWYQRFNDGSQDYTNYYKDYPSAVRAVRAF